MSQCTPSTTIEKNLKKKRQEDNPPYIVGLGSGEPDSYCEYFGDARMVRSHVLLVTLIASV
jgi:hypothetical protein